MAVQSPNPVQHVAEERDLQADVTEALRPRFPDLEADRLRAMIGSAIARLGDVRVTTYLPILVERMVREDLRADVLRLPA
jgi:hypothetical protein